MKEGQNLGFWSIVLLGINSIIGSGIFLLPGQIMRLAGPWSIFLYFIVTGIVLAIAWCFAQCAALFDRNGGAYVYAKAAFGDFIGFEIGIMRWAIGIFAWAALMAGFVTALSSVWPSTQFEPYRTVLILSGVGSLAILNIIGINIFKYVNNVVTVTKILPLIFFILVGVFYLKAAPLPLGQTNNLETLSFGTAALLLFYAFGGFESLVVAAGEMNNPRKNLPLALMTVIAFCSLIYFLLQFIAMGILGEALNSSDTPLADAAQLIAGGWGKGFVTASMLVSIAGINLSASFITPRSGVALAEDGMIPKWVAAKGSFGTPIVAILITAFFTALFALSGNFAQLAVISVVARFAQYISTCLAIFVLYKRRKIALNATKKALFTFIPIVALVGIGWLLWQATLIQLLWGLGALLLGIPLYKLHLKPMPVPQPEKSTPEKDLLF